ncbi:MAG: hypothetical protein LAT65_17200 [Saccharospirillum sp.]|nr:hypothetical protein [Saccharospirillum sp.]
MKNLLILTLATPFVLMGCNSSSDSGGGGGGGGSFNKTPSLQISNANRAMVDEFAIEGVIGLEGGYADLLFDDLDDFSIDINKHAARLMERRSFSARNFNESETYDCDSGTEVYKVTGTGISEEGDISPSGNVTFEITSNNCREEWWEGEYDISNGTIRFTLSWTGYNDVTDTFSSLNFSIKAINSSLYEYIDDELDYFEEFDGEMVSSLSGTNYTNTLDIFFRGSDLGGEGVAAETLTAITGSTDNDHPTAGQWIVRGGGGTTAQYTIEPDGIEVSVNGGQAELITWAEIDANYGSDGWDDW